MGRQADLATGGLFVRSRSSRSSASDSDTDSALEDVVAPVSRSSSPFITKGRTPLPSMIDQPPKIDVVAVSHTDDMFVVTLPTEQVEISRSTIRKIATQLKPYANTRIVDLPPDVRKSMDQLFQFTGWLHAIPDGYKMVADDIREIFAEVSEIRVGTVAAHLEGCRPTADNFPGPLGCNPKCAGSLAPTDDNFQTCQDSVFSFDGKNFLTLANRNTKHAYIHISHNVIDNGTEVLAKLKASGIASVTLLKEDDKGDYQKGAVALPLDKISSLANLAITQSTGDLEESASDEDENPVSSTATVGWVIALILTVIFIVVIAIVLLNPALLAQVMAGGLVIQVLALGVILLGLIFVVIGFTGFSHQ